MAAEVVRAMQDAKAAVRFLRSKKADYRIDDTRIMMGGTSAGGVLSLDYAYLDADELPPYVDMAALGGFEGNSGTPGVSTAINGIVNCWGGLGDSTVVLDGRLPVIHFHGTADNVVPYDIGYSLGNPAFTTFGSACLHRNLVRAGVTSVLKPFPGMGHGVPGGDPRADTLVNMTTAFAYDVLFKTPTALAHSLAPARTAHRGAATFTLDGRLIESAARRLRPAALRVDGDGVLRFR
jgi:acetyl esterase/lipase